MKLTRETRSAFFDGNYPKISGDGQAPTFVGECVRLSSRLSFMVTEIRTTRSGGWSIAYEVLDNRPDRDRYLGSSPALSDAERKAKKRWHEDEEHGYSGNPKSALADAGTAIPPDDQQKQSDDARRKWALYQHSERRMEVANQQQRALANKLRRLIADGARLNVDVTPHIYQALKAAENELAQARQEAA